jgi:hypothetical protein
MRRFLRRLKLALGTLAAGVVFACSGTPGEMEPLAPKPDPVPAQKPVPGAPDPLDPSRERPPTQPPDAGSPINIPAPQFRSGQTPPGDAGVEDALDLPPVPDSLPPDANKQPESAAFNCC